MVSNTALELKDPRNPLIYVCYKASICSAFVCMRPRSGHDWWTQVYSSTVGQDFKREGKGPLSRATRSLGPGLTAPVLGGN